MYPKIDFFIGLFLVVFSAAGYLIAGTLPTAPKGLGPGDYPRVILGLLVILGGILAANALFQMKNTTGKAARHYEKGEVKHVVLLAACVAFYIKILPYFGFLLLTPVFLFAMMYLFGFRKWVEMAAIGVVTTVATFLLFNNFLYVLLPHFNLF